MRLNRLPVARLCASAVVLAFAAACGGGSPAPATPFPSLAAGTVVFAARESQFTTQSVHVPADAPWTLALDNQDSGLPHNVVILDKDNKTVFGSTLVTGPKLYSEPAPALASGDYHFTCAVHSEMHGTLTVP